MPSASASHVDLIRAPCVLYGVKYIDPVSPVVLQPDATMGGCSLTPARDSHLDLIRAPYVLYGVKYIDLVSLAPFPGAVGRQLGDSVGGTKPYDTNTMPL